MGLWPMPALQARARGPCHECTLRSNGPLRFFALNETANLLNHPPEVGFICEELLDECPLYLGDVFPLPSIIRETLQAIAKRRFITETDVIQMRQLLEHGPLFERATRATGSG